MANSVKGQVELRIKDGEEDLTLILVGDHEALIESEGAYRKPLDHLLADFVAGFVGAGRALLYGMLRRHHSQITLGETAEIYLHNRVEVMEKIGEAIKLAFPEAAQLASQMEGKKPGNAPAAQPGKSSGSSGAKRGSTRKGSGRRPRATTK